MDLTEKTLESVVVYDGRILRVEKDWAELPGGKTAVREVVRHPGCVVVLPLEEDGTVVLVRQYRYALAIELLEVPAGKMEPGEAVLTAAARELEEETGYTAEEFISLGACYPSPGFCDEVFHLFLARKLKEGDSHPDEDEFLDVVKIPFERLMELVMNDELRDAKTIITILKAKAFLDRDITEELR